MKKHSLLLVILLVILCEININAQPKIDMVEKLQIKEEQIKELDSITSSLIAENDFLSQMKGLHMYHIFWLMLTDKIEKSEFLNYSFLNKLQTTYDTVLYRSCNLPLIKYLFKEKEEHFFRVQTLITDSVGNLVGTSFGHRLAMPNTINGIRCGPRESPVDVFRVPDTTEFTSKLAKMFFNKQIDFVFIMGFYECYIIGGNQVYIRNNYMTACEKKYGNKIVPLEEYMKSCYDKTNWAK